MLKPVLNKNIADFFTKKNLIPGAFRYTIRFGIAALIILILYSIGEKNDYKTLFSIIGITSIIAFASFSAGGIIGFLFGIPHQSSSNQSKPIQPTLQQLNTSSQLNTNTQTSSALPSSIAAPSYTPSSNLEQIADWLTKIFVGVGLTQIHKIITRFNILCFSLGKSIPDAHNGPTVCGAIIIVFFIIGFLIVYLWAYVFLFQIQNSMCNEILDTVDAKLQNSDNNNKKAIDLANIQLNLPKDSNNIADNDLYDAFNSASGNVISSIFFKAVTQRKLYWNDAANIHKVDKTIPIFQTLIKIGNETEFPENYAELGYALKDKALPDYKNALANLNIAINGFKGNERCSPFIPMAFFNRAICRINLDANFQIAKPSDTDNKNLIQNDLDEASKDENLKQKVTDDNLIKKWKSINTD